MVEDDETLLDLIENTLRRQGYTALKASSGEEALRLCKKSAIGIDLLLTDILMPGMTGLELAQRLHSAHPEMRALYLSGHPPESLVRRGLVEDTWDLVRKPFALEDLLGKVREVLDRDESERPTWLPEPDCPRR